MTSCVGVTLVNVLVPLVKKSPITATETPSVGIPPDPVVAATVRGTDIPPPSVPGEAPVLYGVGVVVVTLPVAILTVIDGPVNAMEIFAVVSAPAVP
jgi:hypothetical protein